jgi:dephospho-CoA kinase
MYAVGLTGGIASGKSTISELFAELGVPVVDTDVISRELLEPGELAYEQVRDHFGDAVLKPDGKIDRGKLREIVFSQHDAKSWLEKMLHPLIYQRSLEAMRAHRRADYVLVVVPLLFETNFQSLVDRVLAVDCPAEQQIERLVRRDGISRELAARMLAQQLDNSTRLERAHDRIDNRGDGDNLAADVRDLHQRYRQLAAAR